MAQEVAILDIGSSKITAVVGRRGANGSIIVSGIGECEYAGFSDGEWYAPGELSYAVGRAISIAETNSRIKIKDIFVGVPGDFTTCVCKELNANFSKKHRINEADVDALHSQGDTFGSDEVYTLINSQPLYYTLDDEVRLLEPIGRVSTRLGGCISYILAEKTFIETISSILEERGITEYDFVSALLAQALFLFDDAQRDRYSILIDIGHITSSVAIIRGDGILHQSSFALGGGYITGDLAMYLEIGYTEAEALRDKVNLALTPTEDETYEIVGRDGPMTFNATYVNEIVKNSIAKIAYNIMLALDACQYDFPSDLDYSLTGGGLSYLVGGREYLSECLDKKIVIAGARLPQMRHPEKSSYFGLLDMVLGSLEEQPKSFFRKLLDKFTKK